MFMKKVICTIIGHKWDNWGKWSPSTAHCSRSRTCVRCKDIETEKQNHHWKKGEDIGDCKQKRECPVCNAQDIQDIHDWVDIEHTSYRDITRKCRNCSKIEQELHEHTWTVVFDGMGNSWRSCTGCGAME